MKILKYLRALLLGAAIPFSYVGVLMVGNDLSFSNSPKIESISHLERLIEEKKRKDGFIGRITAKIDSVGETTIAYSQKMEDNTYKIVINKDFLKTKILEHELYHIFDGHFENPSRFMAGYVHGLKYLFYQEPKTIIHTLIN
jgi:hypothetical protein